MDVYTWSFNRKNREALNLQLESTTHNMDAHVEYQVIIDEQEVDQEKLL